MGYKHLTIEEREVILKMKFSGSFQAEIAENIGRSKSTISRELRRNKSGKEYEAHSAQRKAEKRRRGSKQPVRMTDERLA
ncbi:MAG: helix-turn-helix domain-containing protein, partial [Planctomycetota bacterium]